MIALKNVKERVLTPWLPGTTVILAPTTTAQLAPKWLCPVSGRIKAVVLNIVVASAKGTSADVLDTIKLDKRGITGAVTASAVTSTVTLLKAAATSVIRAAGERVVLAGASGNHCVRGEILELTWTETGTLGDATRPTFTVTGVIFEADQNFDSTQ
jgi:hypothetical protein